MYLRYVDKYLEFKKLQNIVFPFLRNLLLVSYANYPTLQARNIDNTIRFNDVIFLNSPTHNDSSLIFL